VDAPVACLTAAVITLWSFAVGAFGRLLRLPQSVTTVGIARLLIGSVGGALPFTVVAFLFGLPLTHVELVPTTALWSLLMASVTIGPVAAVLGCSDSDQWYRLVIQQRAESRAEELVLACARGACVGAWLSCAAIPLDWDRPWQKWPIPCAVGAVAGHAVAGLAAAVVQLLGWPPRRYERDKEF
jgi:phosphatidylinositol glycan class F